MWLTLFAISFAGPPTPPPVVAGDVRPGDFDATAMRRSLGMDYGVRQPGDLVTVTVLETNDSQIDANTNTTRSSEADGRISGFFGLVTQILTANPSMNMEDSIGLGASSGNSFNGTGITDRAASVTGVVTCKVLEVAPNGNVYLWGYKSIEVNHEVQYMVVEGWARPRDITMDNVVTFERLAEAQISTYGDGVIDDKQGVGIGIRGMDHAWPF